MARLVHHLISTSIVAEPFACAPDHESAKTFIDNEMKGEGVITLAISSACGPCPVCQPEDYERHYTNRRLRNVAVATGPEVLDFDRIACRSDRYGQVGKMKLNGAGFSHSEF